MMIDKQLLKRVEEETCIDYEAYDVVGGNEKQTYLPMDNIEDILKDLLWEIENLKEDLAEARREVEEAKQPNEEDNHEDYMLKREGLL